MSDATVRHKLTGLATALRHFHSALLDQARGDYEFLNGRIDGPFTLYNLVLNDPHFQWLRPLSGLMATLDEVIDRKEALTERNVRDVEQALALLFSATDTRFAEFRDGYERVKKDTRVRETEARWRELLSALDA